MQVKRCVASVHPWRGAAVLAMLMLAAASASGHPYDVVNPKPTDFASAVRRIRIEIAGMERSRRTGDFADLTQRAACIDTLAIDVPGFAMTLSTALEDSAAGRILRSSLRLRTVADELRRAATEHDGGATALAIQQGIEVASSLDAFVPKRYVCPMRCQNGVVYGRPGECPVCGMHLQLVTTDRYSVDVRPVSGSLRPRVPTWLGFRIKDPAGFDVRDLQIVHEKPLHLMIVSHDLSHFSHEHPVRMTDGSFRLRTSFPAPGAYVLYHDFTPDSAGMQVVPVELTVEGDEPPPTQLVVDDASPKRVDGYDVALTHTPLAPGRECAMTFTLTRRGEPVTDLEPFLGAAGHLVMISEDRAAYVHSHPLDRDASTGPSVTFRVAFERTGFYKVWGQFQRRGKVVTVPFVVEVTLEGKRAEPI